MNLLDLLFPKRCLGCQRFGSYFCAICLPKIEYLKEQICPICGKNSIDGTTHPRCQTIYSLDGMYAMAHFRGVIKDAIHLLKYRFVTSLVPDLADFLVNSWPKSMPEFDYLIPIPLHQKKLRERGFNQSTLLAHSLGKNLDIAVMEKIIVKRHATKSQAELDLKERIKNLQDVFAIASDIDLSGKKIALIDDVSTTRTTFIECARVLKRKKAEIVWGIALAHG